MDGLTICKLFRILDSVLLKSRLNSMTVAGNSVYLSFYGEGKINLCFRTAPTPPSIFKTEDISGDSPGAIGAVAGATVSKVASFGYERSGYIELKKRKQSGKLLTYKCVLEPAGNYANFFLLDEDMRILYSLSSRTIDADRDIGAGSIYTLPKPNKKSTLENVSLVTTFADLTGFYPVTSKYADALLDTMDMKEAAEKITKSIMEDDFFYIDKNSKAVPFEFDGYLKKVAWEEVGDYFKPKDKPEGADTTLSAEKIGKFFAEKCDKYIRLAEKLEVELKEAENYEKYATEAELIKNNVYKVKNAGVYQFEKYTESGVEQIAYEVSYGEDLQGKSEKLFKKSARLKRSIPLISERLEETLQMALSAEEQVYYAKNITDTDELYAFEKLIIKGKKPRTSKEKKAALDKPFYEYTTDGFSLYAGRSSYSNHSLVFKFGKDSDIWFHGHNFPSAHVLLRPVGAKELTEDMVIIAAKVVASFSKMKNEKRVDIDYTLRKYVNNPKNTPAGFVTYKKFKTVAVEPFSSEKISEMFGIHKA